MNRTEKVAGITSITRTATVTTTAAPDIRLTREGDVIASIRVGEVYVVNMGCGGRKVKRFFHSGDVGESEQMRGFGYPSARRAADALVRDLGLTA